MRRPIPPKAFLVVLKAFAGQNTGHSAVYTAGKTFAPQFAAELNGTFAHTFDCNDTFDAEALTRARAQSPPRWCRPKRAARRPKPCWRARWSSLNSSATSQGPSRQARKRGLSQHRHGGHRRRYRRAGTDGGALRDNRGGLEPHRPQGRGFYGSFSTTGPGTSAYTSV